MIDDSDGDFALLASMGAGGWFGLALVAIAIALYLTAASNESDCEKRRCPADQHAKVVAHECVCVGVPTAPAGAP